MVLTQSEKKITEQVGQVSPTVLTVEQQRRAEVEKEVLKPEVRKRLEENWASGLVGDKADATKQVLLSNEMLVELYLMEQDLAALVTKAGPEVKTEVQEKATQGIEDKGEPAMAANAADHERKQRYISNEPATRPAQRVGGQSLESSLPDVKIPQVDLAKGEKPGRRNFLKWILMGGGALGLGLAVLEGLQSWNALSVEQQNDLKMLTNQLMRGEITVSEYRVQAMALLQPPLSTPEATQVVETAIAEATKKATPDATQKPANTPEATEVVLPDLSIETGAWPSGFAVEETWVEATPETASAMVAKLNEMYPAMAKLYGPSGFDSHFRRSGDTFPGFNRYLLEPMDEDGVIYAAGLADIEQNDHLVNEQVLANKNVFGRSIIQSDNYGERNGLQWVVTDSKTARKGDYSKQIQGGVYFDDRLMNKEGAKNRFNDLLLERLKGFLKPGARIIVHQSPMDLATPETHPEDRTSGKYLRVIDQFAFSYKILDDQNIIMLNVSIPEAKMDQENEVLEMLYGYGSNAHETAILLALAVAVGAIKYGNELEEWPKLFGDKHPNGRLASQLEKEFGLEKPTYLFKGYRKNE